MVARIPVSGGKAFAIVDDDDLERLSAWKWSLTCRSYGRTKTTTRRYANRRNKQDGFVLMHRFIMGVTSKSLSVDHINGDPLDNRKENLRVCKQGENCRNHRRSSGQIGVRGISKTRAGKFRARIRLNNIGYHIGQFDTLHDASIAYAFASQVFHGEFGSLPGHEAFIADASRLLPEDEDVSMLENIQTA